jgi:hypothetical protein
MDIGANNDQFNFEQLAKGGKGGGKGGKGGGLGAGDDAQDTLTTTEPTTLIKVTVTKDGVTTEHFVAPGQTFNVEPGSQVVVDAGGLVMAAAIDENGELTFTNGADVYTLGGLGSQLTEETSSLGLYNNTTGATDDVAIADILAGVSTAAGGGGGGGATGGGTGSDGTVGFIDIDGDGLPDTPGSAGTGGGFSGGTGTGTPDDIPPGTTGGTTTPEEGAAPGNVTAVDDFFVANGGTGAQLIKGDLEDNDLFAAPATSVSVQEFPAGGVGTIPGTFGFLQVVADGDFTYSVTSAVPQALVGNDFVVDRLTYTALGDEGSTDSGTAVFVLTNAPGFFRQIGTQGDDALFGSGDDIFVSASGTDALELGFGSERIVILREDTGVDTIDFFGDVGFDILDLKDLLDTETSGVADIGLVANGANTDVFDNSADGGGRLVATINGALPGAGVGQLSVSADGEVTLLVPL